MPCRSTSKVSFANSPNNVCVVIRFSFTGASKGKLARYVRWINPVRPLDQVVPQQFAKSPVHIFRVGGCGAVFLGSLRVAQRLNSVGENLRLSG